MRSINRIPTSIASADALFVGVVEKVRAADQSLSEEDRTTAREEAEHSGRSAKYCLKEVRFASVSVPENPKP